MITLLISFWYYSIGAWAILPCGANSQFSNIDSLIHNVALIKGDDRKLRNPGDVAERIEKAQGRIYCLPTPFTKKSVPSKTDLLAQEVFVANAVLAFQNDMAIVNRHMFLDRNGKKLSSIKNCYLEHISSGEIVQMIDAEFPTHPQDGNRINVGHRDFAVVKLATSPDGATFLKESDIIVDTKKDLSAEVKVLSNYADNNKGKAPEAPTMTNCRRYGQYNLHSGALSNVYGTDCDTGAGSSGAQAYIEENGSPKLFGIVSGDFVTAPAGSAWDANKLSTLVVGFDETLFDSYRKLKERTSP